MTGIFRKILNHGRLMTLAGGLAATLAVLVLFQAKPRFLTHLDYKIYDQLLTTHHSEPASGLPVIVDIDEPSLQAYGQWPWPRYRVALLLARLRQAGALAVGLDILFAEEDRTSPSIIQRQLSEELNVDMRFEGLPDQLMDNDRVLAEVLASGPYVLGYSFLFGADQPGGGCAIAPVNVSVLSPPGSRPLEQSLITATAVSCPLDTLLQSAPASGFFSTMTDDDGILRRVPLLLNMDGRTYPSLALATLLQALPSRLILAKMTPRGVESIKVGGQVIPVSEHAEMLLNYRGGGERFPYISAGDILSGDFDPEQIRGKIVFIGTSAAGLLDIRATPFTQYYPGVEAHATIVDNIISGDFITVPDWSVGAQFIAVMVTGIITTLLLTWTRALFLLLPMGGLAAAMWYGTSYCFVNLNHYISPLYPYLNLVLTFGLLTFLKFVREERQKRFIHGAFAHYLAPSVINRIIKDPDALSLEGEERTVTILFSDVRSFTSLSEKLTPTQVTGLLHDYLTPMTRIITEHSGTLDKFIGDAVMAFWNAPLDVPGHEAQALRSAMRQLQELRTLNEQVFGPRFGFDIQVGIGVHSGTVRVGNMGSADLFDYTLIGDNVNLASRMEGLTKYYGQELVVSKSIVDACGDEFVFVELDRVRVKGKLEPITIYTAMSPEEAERREKELGNYQRALTLYREQRFEAAAEVFARLREETGDNKLYDMYHERCITLRSTPPGEKWDGVYTHTSK